MISTNVGPADLVAAAREKRSRFRVEDGLLLALLAAGVARALYHLAYIEHSPFAIAPLTDGRTLAVAAQDVANSFPLGSRPFELVSLYPLVMSLPLLVLPWMALLVLFQLLLMLVGLWAFQRTARRLFGFRAAAASTLVLMTYPALAFYENKFTAVELTVFCTILVLWAFERATASSNPRTHLALGAATGLLLLTTPAALLTVPLALVAVVLAARDGRRPVAPALAWTAVGLCLVLDAITTRNLVVVGQPEVFGRHALSIPFFIGNNPHADGLYNDAGGVIDRGASGGRSALHAGLGLEGVPSAHQDEAIDSALEAQLEYFLTSHPERAAVLVLTKLLHVLGNAEPTEHYDMIGEAELLGHLPHPGLPFGVLIALGLLGLSLLRDQRLQLQPGELSCSGRALWWLLAALIAGPLVFMLMGFVSSEQRVPMSVPLAFMSGPALLSLLRARATRSGGPLRLRMSEVALAACILVQAFVPRGGSTHPSAWHYYHMGYIHERFGNMPDAVTDYAEAIRRDPNQPTFLVHQAQLLMVLLEMEAADRVLARFERIEQPPDNLRHQGQAMRLRLDVIKARWIANGRWRDSAAGDG